MQERNSTSEVDNKLIQVNLNILELKGVSDPRSCCALSIDFLIEESLREVEQVQDVVVSEEEGVVRLWILGEVSVLKEELVARIEDLGFRVGGIEFA